MRAAILEELKSPLNIDSLVIPNLGIGQVLIEVHASGICGKQIGEINGHFGEDKYLPHLLGHEGGGVVVDIGDGVSTVKRGDHVVMHWRKGKGIEARPPKYKRLDNFNLVGAGYITTFNDHAIVSENRLTVIPKYIPFNIAALMGCAVTTGLGIINNEAQLKIGQSIAIFGCGGVGLNVIQGANLVSAYPIIAIDRLSEKLEMATWFGATHKINSNLETTYSDVLESNNGKKIDICIDCTGNAQIIDLALKLTAPNGKLILVGQTQYNKDLVLSNMSQNYNGKMIITSQGGLTNPNIDIPRYLKLYDNGKLNLDNLITHKFKLREINTALDVVKKGEAGRCIIEME